MREGFPSLLNSEDNSFQLINSLKPRHLIGNRALNIGLSAEHIFPAWSLPNKGGFSLRAYQRALVSFHHMHPPVSPKPYLPVGTNHSTCSPTLFTYVCPPRLPCWSALPPLEANSQEVIVSSLAIQTSARDCRRRFRHICSVGY